MKSLQAQREQDHLDHIEWLQEEAFIKQEENDKKNKELNQQIIAVRQESKNELEKQKGSGNFQQDQLRESLIKKEQESVDKVRAVQKDCTAEIAKITEKYAREVKALDKKIHRIERENLQSRQRMQDMMNQELDFKSSEIAGMQQRHDVEMRHKQEEMQNLRVHFEKELQRKDEIIDENWARYDKEIKRLNSVLSQIEKEHIEREQNVRSEHEIKELLYRNKMETLMEEQAELRDQLQAKHENELKSYIQASQDKDQEFKKNLDAIGEKEQNQSKEGKDREQKALRQNSEELAEVKKEMEAMRKNKDSVIQKMIKAAEDERKKSDSAIDSIKKELHDAKAELSRK